MYAIVEAQQVLTLEGRPAGLRHREELYFEPKPSLL